MVIREQLKEISLYTIDKESSNEFTQEIDTTKVSDHVIANYAVDVVNRRYENRRELEFNCLVVEKNEVNDPEHQIASRIEKFIDDLSQYKELTHRIAKRLFSDTPGNAKKGDLVSCLFKMVDVYYFVMLKVDENKFLKRNDDGSWEIDSGLDIHTKLQKAVYIEIPIIDGSFEKDYLLWTVRAIDNVSNDSYYWNINFLDARYKGDKKINTERFSKFVRKFIRTISDPQTQSELSYSYRSYLKVNDGFEIGDFIEKVFGSTDRHGEVRDRFREAIVSQSKHETEGFDLVFDFDRKLADKEANSGGAFVFDRRLKITPTKSNGDKKEDKNVLSEWIKFRDIDESSGKEADFIDDAGKYAKIYYDSYEYKDK